MKSAFINDDKLGDISIHPSLVWIQAVCFSILYATWPLPGTIGIRYTCLIVGFLIGVYQLRRLRKVFFFRVPWAFILLIVLLVWVTTHLIFLSHNFPAQISEYMSIWKRVLIGTIFGVGFGVALTHREIFRENQGVSSRYKTTIMNSGLFLIFYIGIMSPTIIYIIKFLLTSYGHQFGLIIPEFATVFYSGELKYFIPKTVYVCFCVPTLAAILGMLLTNANNARVICFENIIFITSIIAIIFVFYIQNIKNGMAYCTILIFCFIALLFIKRIKLKLLSRFEVLFFLAAAILFLALVSKHIQNNEAWKNIFPDIAASVNIDKNDAWKWENSDVLSYPKNDRDQIVSGTTYERVSWFIAGASMLIDHPLGYGLVQSSFGGLANEKWPQSKLHQSHSGWLDLSLGIGLPGISLLISCMIVTVRSLIKSKSMCKLSAICCWTLCSLFAIWMTTELSQKIFLESLLYWVAFSIGVSQVFRFKMDINPRKVKNERS